MVKEMNDMQIEPYGTKFLEDGSVKFNFWAPDVNGVKLCLKTDNSFQEIQMEKNKEELYTIVTNQATDGLLYGYKINDELIVPDPASRYQPEDAHGLSQLINPENFDWEDDYKWMGRPWKDVVLYELHTGTFTKEGTFNAIKDKLDYFVDLGITAIELMPVADFPGKRNWGYDGVLIYAPDSSYGTSDDLKNLIKAAHKKGLMVFLDVVYNHFGPDGNYLYKYAKSEFFDEKIKTPWGDAINFKNKYVRNFFINNALYWLNEYHFDGLRFDAFHEIYDDSTPNIIEELATKIKENLSSNRKIHLVLENGKNESRYLEKAYEAQWNDDFHHCVHVLTTGEKGSYYAGYTKETTDKPPSYHLAKTLTEGFAYQGKRTLYKDNVLRGEKSSHLPLSKFVNFIQNHDQVGNRAFGERISVLSNDNLIKAAACLYLLAPSIPLMFMGEEWGSKSPFYFFCNFNKELAKAVKAGRKEESANFSQISDPKIKDSIPDPSLEKTFLDSKLNWDDLEENYRQMFDFYKEMLSIRKEKIISIIKKIKKRSFEIYTDKSLSVNWNIEHYDKKMLSVLANFEDTSIGISSCINEEEIIAVSKLEAKNEIINNKLLPAETVVWCLK